MNGSQDTIAAIATAAGRGGVGVIRISGPRVPDVAERILKRLPKPRYATFSPFLDAEGDVLDQGLALYFPAPRSFTGEDVLELHAHGGPVLLDMLLQCVLTVAGTRLARPGEFSERAFLNDKIDLLQAEAIADLIDSASTQAVHSAAKSLQGEFSHRIQAWLTDLISLRVYVEGAIDFPEEEIDFLKEGQVAERLHGLAQTLDAVLASARQGALLREGMRVVIVGQPNVGKSSLINRLAGEELAIVSDIPGTTRDVIQQQILINGMPVHIVDTAGIREAVDQIEKEGIKRALSQMEQADRILLLEEPGDEGNTDIQSFLEHIPNTVPITVVINKIDLKNLSPKQEHHRYETIYLSAKTGEGLNLLRDHLAQCMGLSQSEGEGVFIARRRHLDALQRIKTLLQQSMDNFTNHNAGELLAEDLAEIQRISGEITGEFSSDDLLGEIFSRFCIGK